MERIVEAVASYVPQNNRSQQMLSGRENCLILDCYNANPSSMAVAIDNMKSVEAEQKWLILGDMLELGEWSEEAHLNILHKADTVAERIILVGNEFAKAYGKSEGLAAEYALYPTTDDAKVAINEKPISDALVLLKGSRGIALEKLIEKL